VCTCAKVRLFQSEPGSIAAERRGCTSIDRRLVRAGQVHVLADPHLELTKALGVVMEAQDKLGTDRCKRFSAVIVDNTFKACPVACTPACPAWAWQSHTMRAGCAGVQPGARWWRPDVLPGGADDGSAQVSLNLCLK